MKHIASFSGGKDSLAMVLRLIEEEKPLDEVVFFDTGMEFKAIYNNCDKLKKLLTAKKITFTTLYPSCSFLYKMLDKEVKKRNGDRQKGYSWCGGRCRWGTTEKVSALEKYSDGCYEYIGIAVDETQRITKKRKPNKLMPLVSWAMTEDDCLAYCRSRGWDWKEGDVDLYDILDRVSCWCCGNKNLKELKNYYLYLPQYWEKLKELQLKTDRPFKGNKTMFDLEERFVQESKK